MDDRKVPVRENVGAALRFVRENWRPIAIVSAISSAALTILAAMSDVSPMLGLPVWLISTFVNALTSAVFIGACLSGFTGWRQRIRGDGLRVWGAIAVVGFFLFIVAIVLGLPGLVVFLVLMWPRYGVELQGAGNDQAAMATVLERIVSENSGVVLCFMIFYALVWLALTSRLYAAAPASVDARRILTFETWSWTRGNMWRVMGARLMLLTPAYILTAGVSYLIAGAMGFRVNDPASAEAFAHQARPLYLIFLFVSGFLQLGLYSALEAGLSTYLYRGLKPQTPAPSV